MLPALSGVAGSSGYSSRGSRRGGRVVEGGGLENRRRSRVRGFESLPLRQLCLAGVALLLIGVSAVSHADPPRARIEARLARALSDGAAADTEMRRQASERRGVTRAGELAVVLEP